MTIHEFITAHGITMRSERITARTDKTASDFPPGSSHWRCTLARRQNGKRRTMTVEFSMGPAHKFAPDTAMVLDCIASDCADVPLSFGEWCSDFGSDSDSRKALATYQAIRKQRNRLIKFLTGARAAKPSDGQPDAISELFACERL